MELLIVFFAKLLVARQDHSLGSCNNIDIVYG